MEDYYCAKFQVIPVNGFRLIVLTHTHTHKHTNAHHRDKVIVTSAPTHYVVGPNVCST